MYALNFKEKIRSPALLVNFLERFGEKKYDNRKFDGKITPKTKMRRRNFFEAFEA